MFLLLIVLMMLPLSARSLGRPALNCKMTIHHSLQKSNWNLQAASSITTRQMESKRNAVLACLMKQLICHPNQCNFYSHSTNLFRSPEEPAGCGFFYVIPTLKAGKDEEVLSLDAIQCLTFISKLLGKFTIINTVYQLLCQTL